MSSSSDEEKSSGDEEKPKRRNNKKNKKNKRPPGRPRRVPEVPPAEIKGIVLKPESIKNVFELLYYRTAHLKKIAQLIKNIKAQSVQILTNEKEMILFAQNPYKNNTIMVVFHGDKMHHFYNKSHMDIGVGASNLITVFKKINKKHSSVGIMQSEDELGRWIEVALINGDVGIRTEQSISTIPVYTKLTEEMKQEFLDTAGYAVSFKYFQYDFKRLISDSKSFQERILFRKSGLEPLSIEYNNTDGQIKARDIIDGSNEKINMISKVKESELFVVSVQIESLRAISSASLGDSVDIYLQEKKDLKTIINISDGITVYTKTKVSQKKIDSKKSDSDDESDEPKKSKMRTKVKKDEESEDSDVLSLKKKVEQSEDSDDSSD